MTQGELAPSVPRAQLPLLPRVIHTLSTPATERLERMYKDEMYSVRRCVTCRGQGTFRWWAPGEYGKTIAEYDCNCINQFKLHRNLLWAGVLLAYQRLSWDDVQAEAGAIDKIRDYLDHSQAYINHGYGLILHGTMGSGKTMLANLLLKALIAAGNDCYLTTFSSMIDAFMGSWHDQEQREWFHSRVKNVGILVIDDIGREYKQRRMITRALAEKLDTDKATLDYKTQQAEAAFDEVLRHRVGSSRPTIITTNLDLEEMIEYGDNIMSLLHERSTTYRFVGADFRANFLLRMNQEIRQGLTRPVVIG